VTVCGFAKTRDGRAFAWADSEVYRDDSPVGSAVKLACSQAGIVGAATGYLDLAKEFVQRVERLGAMSISGAIATLPARLRAARDAKIKRMRELDCAYEPHTVYGLVGWTGAEMLGAVFDEGRDFAPVITEAWLSPHVDASPATAAEVLAVAQKQLGYVRQHIPKATGLMLSIARLGPAGIAQTSVPLLIAGETAPVPAPTRAVSGDSPAHMVAAVRAAEDERVRRYWRGSA